MVQRVLDALTVDAISGGGPPIPIWTVSEYGRLLKSGVAKFAHGVICRDDLSEQDEKDAEDIEKELSKVEYSLTSLIWGRPS